MKSGNLNFLEPSGPLQACNGTALLLLLHTATDIYQTDTAVCLLASRQQYLFGCCMYSLELLMMDGKTVRNM